MNLQYKHSKSECKAYCKTFVFSTVNPLFRTYCRNVRTSMSDYRQLFSCKLFYFDYWLNQLNVSMKKNYLLGLAGLGALYIALSSASGGVAAVQNADRTGSPVASQACNMCHSGGSFTSSTAIKLKDSGGAEVTQYLPGETYTLEMTVNHTGASRFGVQGVALFADNSTAGTWAQKSSNGKLTTLSGRTYGEQTSASTSNVFEFEWTAPAAGSGSVTFYANGLAADGNGSTSGDELATGGSLAVSEDVSSGLVDLNGTALKMYPNPSTDFVIIDGLTNAETVIRVYDFSGRTVKEVSANTSTVRIDLNELSKGTYFIQAANNSVQKLVKY